MQKSVMINEKLKADGFGGKENNHELDVIDEPQCDGVDKVHKLFLVHNDSTEMCVCRCIGHCSCDCDRKAF